MRGIRDRPPSSPVRVEGQGVALAEEGGLEAESRAASVEKTMRKLPGGVGWMSGGGALCVCRGWGRVGREQGIGPWPPWLPEAECAALGAVCSYRHDLSSGTRWP